MQERIEQERIEIENVWKESSPDKSFWRELSDIFLFYLRIFLATIIFAAVFFFLYAGIYARIKAINPSSDISTIVVSAGIALFGSIVFFLLLLIARFLLKRLISSIGEAQGKGASA